MNTKTLFWNVDTQNDFMNSDGLLYVGGAEEIKPQLKALTEYARTKGIYTVNTADRHFEDSKELSNNPDFINTFPRHCMAHSDGANFIKETNPDGGIVIYIDWRNVFSGEDFLRLDYATGLVIYKDAFDVFVGNQNTKKIINILKPERVFVYGVATNVCVNCAVVGLVNFVKEVYVVIDAIKELPKIPLDALVDNWVKIGVKFVAFDLNNLNNNTVAKLLSERHPTVKVEALKALV